MKDYKETGTWWTRYVEPSGEATVGAANMNVRAPALLPSVCVDVSRRVWLCMRVSDCGACPRSEASACPLCMRFYRFAALLPPAPLAAAAAAPHDTLPHRRALQVARSEQAGGGACRRKRPKSLPGSTGMLGGCLTLSIMSSAPQLRPSAAQRKGRSATDAADADEVARRCGPVMGWSGGGRSSGGHSRPQRRGREDQMEE